jgi:hypothetical protein
MIRKHPGVVGGILVESGPLAIEYRGCSEPRRRAIPSGMASQIPVLDKIRQ